MDKILIVEDDKALAQALKITLQNAGFIVNVALEVNAAKQILNNTQIDIVISDIQLGQESGLTLFEYVKKNHTQIAVLLMTAYGKINDAVWAIQQGASDYITKPFQGNELIERIHSILHKKVFTQLNMIQEDNATKSIVELSRKISQTDASVLISGESGTGKEVFAKFIHDNSPRKNNAFVAINCAAIPDNMLEAILFGYEKGAFTGAYQTVEGKLELGNSGTILLDEISEMPMQLQAKLLRVIQEREVERLGAKKVIKLDIRIIATTNRNLAKEVEEQKFRKDLYFRLNVIPLLIPPLRARKNDIIPLANYFIKYFHNTTDTLTLSKEAQNRLLEYSWPGNIRELQNVIQRAIIYSKDGEIKNTDIHFENENTLSAHHAVAKMTLNDQLIDKENDLILKVLNESDNDRNVAAQQLKISTRTLRTKIARMKKMGIII